MKDPITDEDLDASNVNIFFSPELITYSKKHFMFEQRHLNCV